MLDATKTVREFAVQIPHATKLFEKLSIDYCCGGGKPLTEACLQANVPVEEVVCALQDGPPRSSREDAEWSTATLSDLIGHIVTKHHAYVKQELPRLDRLMSKVAGKHAEKHGELRRMLALFAGLNSELTSHLMKEENILFSYVEELESSSEQPSRSPMFGSVKNPIHMMELEHDSARDALKEMRAVSDGFSSPEDGCMSFKALYQGLAEFEADLHQHIHLENNILFPRAIELESRTK